MRYFGILVTLTAAAACQDAFDPVPNGKQLSIIDAGSEAIKAAERLLPLRNLHLRVGRRAP